MKINTTNRCLSIILCIMMLMSAMTVTAFADDTNSVGLWGINVGTISIPDFDSSVTTYEVGVPYIYKTNDFENVEVPQITAFPKDPDAEVTVTGPDAIPGTATIEVANGDASASYTINFTKTNMNMYGDGGFETDSWVSAQRWTTALTCSLYTDNPKAGDSAFKYNVKDTFPWGYPEGLALSNGTRYLLTYYACEPGNNNISWYGGSVNGSYFSEKTYYNEDGSTRTGDYLGKLSAEWTRAIQTYTPNRDIEGNGSVKFGPINFNGKYDVVLDEMYLAPLDVTEIIYTGDKTSLIPLEGTRELVLSAQLKNQIDGTHGLEELSVNYSLLSDVTGVCISGDTLIIEPDAEEGIVYVCASVSHSFSGEEETVSSIIPIEVVAIGESDAELLDVKLGGLSIPDFDPMVREYNVMVPYTYIPNDFTTVNVPDVEYLKKNTDALVTVNYPESVDGETITIDVVCGEDTATYVINMTAIGLNMYNDGGFETTAWVNANSGRTGVFDGSMVSRSDENPKAGSYALSFGVANGSAGGASVLAPNTPRLKAGIKYIHNGYFRRTSDDNRSLWNGSNSNKSSHYNENSSLKASDLIDSTGTDWTRLISTHTVTADKEFYVNPMHFTAGVNVPGELDDYFLSPLYITGITYVGDDLEIGIPEGDDVRLEYFLKAKMTNALGGTHGLENSTVVFGLKEDYPGVSIENNDTLVITQDAEVGPLIVTMTASTDFENGQGTVMNTVYSYMRTSAQDASMPKARYVYAERSASASGYTVEGSYSYYHAMSEPEGNTYTIWQHSTDGRNFEDISGTEGVLTYEVAEEYIDDYLRFKVIPYTESGTEGNEYCSNVLTIPTAPVANNIIVDGVCAVDEILKGSYVYYDVNGDKESGTAFSWHIAETQSGPFTPIPGETSMNYQISEADIGKYICFGVAPRAGLTPYGDTTFLSAPVLAAAKPVISDVEIINKGSGLYVVSYKYSHPTGISEGETSVVWTVGGNKVGTGNSVNMSASSTSKLTVTVTPVATKKPFDGDSVAASVNIDTGSSGAVKRPSSGGGGGSSVIVPVPPEPVATEEPVVFKHWAQDGIDFVLSNGIMQNRSKDDFGNAELVTRADFVYYIIKVLGGGESTYAFEFADVSGNDYYAGALQKAVDLGIISRADNFEPLRNVTRQEIGKILVTAVGKTGDSEPELSQFSDAQTIGDWARGYVSQCVKAGLLKGVSDTEFLPLGMVTREQSAVILKRIYDYMNGGIN